MDLRTGRIYSTKGEALAAGVPESDIAEFVMTDGQKSKGKKHALANGVPIPMGRVIAQAVKQAIGYELRPRA